MSGAESFHAMGGGHDKLEGQVAAHLRTLGFLCGSATYHEVMGKTVQRRLSQVYTPTALYIRGRADRVAVHKTLPLCFECEIKQQDVGNKRTFTLEALPLLHHSFKASLGCRCLYVCKMRGNRPVFGFWVHQLPALKEIWVPLRWKASTPPLHEFFVKTFTTYFPSVPLITDRSVRGSGDPFAIIDGDVVDTLPPWQSLVDPLVRPT